MNSSKPAIVLGVSILVLASFVLFVANLKTDKSATLASVVTSKIIPDMIESELPWSLRPEGLHSRLEGLNLPALEEEGNVLHTHQHLDLTIDGNVVPIPADIGVRDSFISPIHTHNGTGVIHVESPTVETFTLGQFFSIWGVRLDEKCIGGYCADSENSLRVFVNGKEVPGDPSFIVLEPREEIAIFYGAASRQVNPPASYAFEAGF